MLRRAPRRRAGSRAPAGRRRPCWHRAARGRCAAGARARTATTRTRARRPRGPRARAGPTARRAAARGRARRGRCGASRARRGCRRRRTRPRARRGCGRAAPPAASRAGPAPLRPRMPSSCGEVGLDALPRDVHVGEAERNLGRHAGVDVALPLGALLLDAGERLVHVGDVDARAGCTRARDGAGGAGSRRSATAHPGAGRAPR